MSADELFTREEALGGLPARRAATLLFLVESRAAQLADRSRRAADFLLSEDAERDRELVFLEAFSIGREPPVKPTIQDLERYAPQWAPMIPANPSVRAGVARLLGQKYRFTARAAPALRRALGLDEEPVRRAYQRLYNQDLGSIFAAELRVAQRVSWAWERLGSRVDSLPPFWLAFGLTVAFSFSQAFLALPSGVAPFGVIPGVALVIAVGIINVLTMACMAEACARSGDFRYGRAFVGRLVSDYLGPEASALFAVITALRTFLVMLAGSIGIGLTLAAFTGLRAELWMTILLAVELYYLAQRAVNFTITTMLSLIGVNLALLLPITVLAFGHADPENLLRMALPAPGGTSYDAALMKLAFGVVAMLYIGHIYVVQCAKIVLPRDPSARALIGGSVAGTVFLMGLFVMWLLAVNGAVDGARLAREAGTALVPLAEQVGPAIHVLGSALAVLLLGLSCLRTSTVLFNLVQERIPTRLRAVVALPRRRGTLLCRLRRARPGGPRLAFQYLGLDGGLARLRVEARADGRLERADVAMAGPWRASALLERVTGPSPRASLELQVLEADEDAVRLRVSTTMSVSYGGEWSGAGLRPADALSLPDALRGIVNWMTRRGEVTLDDAAAAWGDDARAALDELIAMEFVEATGDDAHRRYRVRLGARQGRNLPADIWQAVSDPGPRPGTSSGAARRRLRGLALRSRDLVLSERGRFLLSASPAFLVFVIGQVLLAAGTASFAAVLGFGGVIANSLTAGIFPVLLLFVSRRKGDYVPALVYRILDHPVFTTSVCLIFLIELFAHGLFIYDSPWARGSALFAGLAVLGAMVAMTRRGAFRRRSVVEFRQDMRDGGRWTVEVTSSGRPHTVDMRLGDPDGERRHRGATAAGPALETLRYVALDLPASSARELKVWTHRVTADGVSEAVPAAVEVCVGGEARRFEQTASDAYAVVAVSGAACSVTITFPEADAEATRPRPASPVGAVRRE